MTSAQKMTRFFMSAENFVKAKAESMEWFFDCECGHSFSVWDAGGIRYKASGNPIKAARCPSCKKVASRKMTRRQSE